MLRKIVSAMARGRNGMALLPVVIGVAAVGLLVYPVLRWYFSMIQGTANLEDRLEMQIITQEYLGRINAATYDELVQTAAARGSSWTEDVGGKYEAKIEIGEDGKFADAKCDTEAAIGDGDKRCRTATITLTSKSDPSQVMNLSTISVATTGRIPEIQRRLSVQDDRFGEYYTKGEGDGHFACPWDYKMNAANTACVPCDAPTWKQYKNGNCSLYTCPTGQKANAAGNGCEQITCPADKVLDGDECVYPLRKVSDSCLYVPKGYNMGMQCTSYFGASRSYTAPKSLTMCCHISRSFNSNGHATRSSTNHMSLRGGSLSTGDLFMCNTSIPNSLYSDEYRNYAHSGYANWYGFSLWCPCSGSRCSDGD